MNAMLDNITEDNWFEGNESEDSIEYQKNRIGTQWSTMRKQLDNYPAKFPEPRARHFRFLGVEPEYDNKILSLELEIQDATNAGNNDDAKTLSSVLGEIRKKKQDREALYASDVELYQKYLLGRNAGLIDSRRNAMLTGSTKKEAEYDERIKQLLDNRTVSQETIQKYSDSEVLKLNSRYGDWKFRVADAIVTEIPKSAIASAAAIEEEVVRLFYDDRKGTFGKTLRDANVMLGHKPSPKYERTVIGRYADTLDKEMNIQRYMRNVGYRGTKHPLLSKFGTEGAAMLAKYALYSTLGKVMAGSSVKGEAATAGSIRKIFDSGNAGLNAYSAVITTEAYGQALLATEGMKGMSQGKRHLFSSLMAMSEFGMMRAFTLAGLGGMERGFRSGIATGRQVVEELTEELSTALIQMGLAESFGVDPDAFKPDRMYETLRDVAGITLAATGPMGVIGLAGRKRGSSDTTDSEHYDYRNGEEHANRDVERMYRDRIEEALSEDNKEDTNGDVPSEVSTPPSATSQIEQTSSVLQIEQSAESKEGEINKRFQEAVDRELPPVESPTEEANRKFQEAAATITEEQKNAQIPSRLEQFVEKYKDRTPSRKEFREDTGHKGDTSKTWRKKYVETATRLRNTIRNAIESQTKAANEAILEEKLGPKAYKEQLFKKEILGKFNPGEKWNPKNPPSELSKEEKKRWRKASRRMGDLWNAVEGYGENDSKKDLLAATGNDLETMEQFLDEMDSLELDSKESEPDRRKIWEWALGYNSEKYAVKSDAGSQAKKDSAASRSAAYSAMRRKAAKIKKVLSEDDEAVLSKKGMLYIDTLAQEMPHIPSLNGPGDVDSARELLVEILKGEMPSARKSKKKVEINALDVMTEKAVSIDGGDAMMSHALEKEGLIETEPEPSYDEDFMVSPRSSMDSNLSPEPESVSTPDPPQTTHGTFDARTGSGDYMDGLDKILPMPTVEMTVMMKELNTILRVAKLPERVLGSANRRYRKVMLNGDLGNNPHEFARVFAHEIGHIFDMIDRYGTPDSVKRGNLLGRLATLRKFYGHVIPLDSDATEQTIEMSRMQHAALRDAIIRKSSHEYEYYLSKVIRDLDGITEEDFDTLVGTEEQLDLFPLSDVEKKAIVLDAIVGMSDRRRSILFRDLTFSIQTKSKFDNKALHEELKGSLERYRIVSLEVIKEELVKLSEAINPYDKELAKKNDPEYAKMRNGEKSKYSKTPGRELYADLMSAFLNSPGMVEDIAPTTYKTLLGYFQNKPDAAEAFIQLQMILKGTPSEVAISRSKRLRDMYKRGDSIMLTYWNKERRHWGGVFENFFEQGTEHGKESLKHLWHSAGATIMSTAFPGYREAAKRRRAGKHTEIDRNIELWLRVGQTSHAFHERVIAKVNKPLRQANIPLEDLSEFLFLQSVQGARRNLITLGWTPELARKHETELVRKWGKEKYNKIKSAANTFHEEVFKVMKYAHGVGWISDKVFDNAVVKNANSYMTVLVLDEVEGSTDPTIYPAKGTMKDISDPYKATLMKAMAIFDSAKRNHLKQEFLKELSFAEAPLLSDTQAPDPGTAAWTVMNNGVKKRRQIPYEFYAVMESLSPDGASRILNVIRAVNYKVFYPLYIMFKYSFGMRNLVRDPMAAFLKAEPTLEIYRAELKNKFMTENPSLTPKAARKEVMRQINRLWMPHLILQAIKAIPKAYRQSIGLYDEDINSYIERGILDTTLFSLSRHGESELGAHQLRKMLVENEDLSYDEVKEHMGRAQYKWLKLKRWHEDMTKKYPVLGAASTASERALFLVRDIINSSDMMWKIAAVREGEARGLSENQIANLVHNAVGTPNTKHKGHLAGLIDGASLFQSISWAATASQIRLIENKASRSNYLKRFSVMTILPVIAWKMVEYGLDDDNKLKDMLSVIGNWAKSHNIIIPIEWVYDEEDGDMKVAYWQLPKDEFSGTASAAFALTFDAVMEKDGDKVWKAAKDALGSTIGTWSPNIKLIGAAFDHMSNKQTYDAFYGLPVVPASALSLARAGESGPALSYRLGWAAKQFGAGERPLRWAYESMTGEDLPRPFEAGLRTTIEKEFEDSLVGPLFKISKGRNTVENYETKRQQADEKAMQREGLRTYRDTLVMNGLAYGAIGIKVANRSRNQHMQADVAKRWIKWIGQWDKVAINERSNGHKDRLSKIAKKVRDSTALWVPLFNASDTEEKNLLWSKIIDHNEMMNRTILGPHSP